MARWQRERRQQALIVTVFSAILFFVVGLVVWTATDRFYAWAKVDVRRSGKVRITGYGFDDQFGATHHLQSIELPH